MSKEFQAKFSDDSESDITSFYEKQGQSTTYLSSLLKQSKPRLNSSNSMKALAQFEETSIINLQN